MTKLDWDADRVLDKLAGIYDDLARGHGVMVEGEAGVVLDTVRAVFPETEQRALLEYSRRKICEGRAAAPLDDRTAKTLAGVVAMNLNRQMQGLPAG